MRRCHGSQWLGRLGVLAACLSVLAVGGCGGGLHQYPRMTGEESLRVLTQRQRGVSTVEGVGTVTLTDATGRQVRLEAALVARMPDRIRVRGWKLGHGVLDVTRLEDGLWVWQGGSGSEHAEQAPEHVAQDPEHVGHGVEAILRIMSGELYDGAAVTDESSVREIRALARDAGDLVEIVIDRPTLTVREIRGGSESGVIVRLLDYRMIGETPWPHRVEVSAPEGRIVLQLGDVQLGEETAPGAFTPPREAVRLR